MAQLGSALGSGLCAFALTIVKEIVKIVDITMFLSFVL